MARPSARPSRILLANNDWKNWTESLPVEEGDPAKHKRVASPRPGHADLAGALKYNFSEARYVLERASARESAARVAAGAIAKLFLRELGIEVLSHVIAVGKRTPRQAGSLGAIEQLAAKEDILLELRRPRIRSTHEGAGGPSRCAPATPSAASSKLSRTTFRPAWAPTPTGTSASTRSSPRP